MKPALLVALLPAIAMAQQAATQIPSSAPGNGGSRAVLVQGIAGGTPMPIVGTLSVAGAANTIGANATFNANGVCATVLLAGQQSAGFDLAAGTLAATFTPSYSQNATEVSPGCNPATGDWFPTSFVDISGNTTATQAVTNPNAAIQFGLKSIGGTACFRVCTTSFTSGSAVGALKATTAPSTLAPSADVTDRAARLLGKISGSDGSVVATANTGRLQVDVVTGGGGGASDAAATAGASESATNRSASFSAIRLLDTAQLAGLQLVAWKGDQTSGAWVNVKSSVLPTGAATDRTTAAAPFSVHLSDGAAFIDPRSIRALTSADVVSAAQSGTWTVGLSVGAKVRQTDGTLDLSLLNSAPVSDTGQIAVPVRVISQLGAGGGGAASSVAINDGTITTQKLAVDAAGLIGLNNFPATQAVSGTVTANAGTGSMTVDQAVAANLNATVTGTVALSTTPAPQCTTVANISQTASTQLVTGTAAQKLYICSILIVSATAQSVSLVEGTGTTCATGIAGLIGGTTASVALAANGGWSQTAGLPFMVSKTAAHNLCLLQSSTGNVSGMISYVSAP